MNKNNDKLINELNNPVFKDEFWVFLLIVLFVFILGFITGSVAHDTCCHAIEQSMG